MDPPPKRRGGANLTASLKPKPMKRHRRSVSPVRLRDSSGEIHDRPQSPLLSDSLAVPIDAQVLQEPDVSSLKEEALDTATLEESGAAASPSSPLAEAVAQDDTVVVSPPPGRLSLGPGPPIMSRRPCEWPKTFLIRTDRGGAFHIYPPIGGPFQSVKDADDAINRHLDDLRDKSVCLDDLSLAEKATRNTLYWPDGTRKKLSKSLVDQERVEHTSLLVQALLDKYNEDHNLLGDLAYKLKDIVCIKSICEGSPHDCKWYYHLNFTARSKGDNDNLFFAEVTRIGGQYKDFALSCFYMLKDNDNGPCRGCTWNKKVNLNMKHPNDGDAYSGGHLEPYLPYGGDSTIQYSGSDQNLDPEEEEASLQAKEEARVKDIYECFDDPSFLEQMRTRFKGHPRAETFFQLRASIVESSQQAITSSMSAKSYVEEREVRREKQAGASCVAGR